MNPFYSSPNPAGPNRTLSSVCRLSCQKLVAQIQRTKHAILSEFLQTFEAPEHLLRLALNEAEALAWQTTVPHLVFPTLAAEKAEALAAWLTRQRSNQLRDPRAT